MLNRVLALDVGGTKLAAGVVGSDGAVLTSRRVPTDAAADPEKLFDDVVALLESVLPGNAVQGIGAGCGGPMTREGVSPLNIPAWRGFPLGARLAEHFCLPVVLDNDAKAMALGEGWCGAARGHSHFVGLVVSTGVGGGIVLDGRLLDGEDTNAGHIGHVIVDPSGAPCACGARGCVEAEASGTAIARMAAAATGDPAVTAADVAKSAAAGDDVAVGILAHAGAMVGRAIADVANLLDLRLAVVGGGVSGAGDLLFGPMRVEAARCARLDHSRDLQIRPAVLGSEAGLVGAAALWFARRWGGAGSIGGDGV